MFQKLCYCLCALCILVACTVQNSAPGAESSTAPTIPAAAPVGGTGLLRGQLFSSTGQVLANRSVRLATVYGEGTSLAYVADDSGGIGGVTDASGVFAINNIPAGRYVVLLVLREGVSVALLQPNGSEKIITITPDALVDLGPAKIRLPE